MTHTDDNSNFLKYQDLTKYCIGHGVPFSFSLSTKDGTSFSFSSPGLPKLSLHSFPPPTRQTSWRNTEINRKWEHSHPVTFKHKTPSQRRRDQRRWTEFQEKKTAPSGTSKPSSNIAEQPSILESSPTLDSEPPIILDLPLIMESPPPSGDGSQPTETGPKPLLTVTGSQPPETGPKPPFTETQPTLTRSHLPATGHSPMATGSKPQTVIKKLDSPVSMEVEAPPAMMSPMTSPEKKGSLVIANLSEYSEQLSKILNDPKNSDGTTPITAFIHANNSKSALSALNRTLKKCNLRSIEPRQVDQSKDWLLDEGEYAFYFKTINKNAKNTVFNIKNNWTYFQESQLSGFFIKNFRGVFFRNS